MVLRVQILHPDQLGLSVVSTFSSHDILGKILNLTVPRFSYY